MLTILASLVVITILVIFALSILSLIKKEYAIIFKALIKRVKKMTFSQLIDMMQVKNKDRKLPMVHRLIRYVDENLSTKVQFINETDFDFELSEEISLNLSQRLLETNYNKNSLVFKSGDVPEQLYFILEGAVRVYSINCVEICTLNKYNFFGEMELSLKLCSRNITVVTGDEPCVFLELNKTDFYELFQDNSFNRIMIETAKQRYQLLVITGFINNSF